MKHQLDPIKLIQTADQLALRVRERLPGSGLSRVAEDVAQVARRARAIAARVSWPNRPLRLLGILLTAALAVGAGYAGISLRAPLPVDNPAELAQGIEALINIIVFGGIAIYFVFSIEGRLKRHRVHGLISELRSLAHVIDMHQLAKDPDRLDDALPRTENSPPKLQLTPPLLARYLDYCSELLAILSKLAALQVQNFDDAIAMASVNDLETLNAGLSRKIWQKIMIIDRLHGSGTRPDASPRPSPFASPTASSTASPPMPPAAAVAVPLPNERD